MAIKGEIKIVAAFPICAFAMFKGAIEFSSRSGLSDSITWLIFVIILFSPVYLIVAHCYYHVRKKFTPKASLTAAIFYGLAVWVAICLYSIHANLLPSSERHLKFYEKPSSPRLIKPPVDSGTPPPEEEK